MKHARSNIENRKTSVRKEEKKIKKNMERLKAMEDREIRNFYQVEKKF